MPEPMKRREMLKGSVAMSMGMVAAGKAGAVPDENPFPPKKIEYAEPESYSPLAYLEKVADATTPEMSFRATDAAAADQWREELRGRLWRVLGEKPHMPGRPVPASRRLSTETLDDHVREKWELDVVPGRSMPVWVLKPRGVSGRTRTALCLHGHGGGAKDIINLPESDEQAELIGILNTDYALQCVRRGWCAVAPDLFAFGERLDYVEDARPGFDGGCEKPFLNAVQVGKTLIGIRAKDICVLIDWMGSRDEFDLSGLPCIGLSGGGMMTMYTSALDDRIRRALIAGYVTEATGSVLPVRHCSCNYVPGLYPLADFPDIAAMIAPRMLIVQSGKKDAIFPVESVRAAYAKIEKAYRVYGATDNLSLDLHDGYHSFWSPSLDRLLV